MNWVVHLVVHLAIQLLSSREHFKFEDEILEVQHKVKMEAEELKPMINWSEYMGKLVEKELFELPKSLAVTWPWIDNEGLVLDACDWP